MKARKLVLNAHINAIVWIRIEYFLNLSLPVPPDADYILLSPLPSYLRLFVPPTLSNTMLTIFGSHRRLQDSKSPVPPLLTRPLEADLAYRGVWDFLYYFKSPGPLGFTIKSLTNVYNSASLSPYHLQKAVAN